jgi:hypothetical protein
MMDLGNTFRRIANVLDESRTPYMLVGSFASSFYEALRGTQDVDIVIAPDKEQFERLLLHLKQADYYTDSYALTALRERSMFNALDNETGWKIDFIFCKPRPYDQEAFRRRKKTIFQGVPFSIATAEDVILGKLEWAKMGESHRQLEDASIVLKKNREQLDFPYMERWVKELGIDIQFKSACESAGLH